MRLYTSPKEMKHKIMVGNFTVWSILLVSLMVSIFYWYQISGITTASKKIGAFEEALLWSAVAIGFLSELVKKVTLSTFRNKTIWVFATIVSIVTVMGSFALLDQNRGVALKQGSDTYTTAKDDKATYKKQMGDYAHVASKPLQSLLDAETANIKKGGSNAARRQSKMSYSQFVANRDRIKQAITDREAYDKAKAMYEMAGDDMGSSGGSGDEMSNPLFGQIHTVTGFTINAITLTFFLAVTLLLEISAYYIGGEIQQFKNFLNLTEAELLDIEIISMFGVSMQAMQRDNFARVTDALRDRKLADERIIELRANRVGRNGEPLSSGETSQQVREERDVQEDNHRQARASHYTIAGALDLEGHSLDVLKARRASVDRGSQMPVCPACSTGFTRVSRQDVFCHPDHRREFNNQIRRLGRET
jgi:hypothetical protein